MLLSLLRLLWLLLTPIVLMLGLAAAGWFYQWVATWLSRQLGFGTARAGVRQRPYFIYWIFALALLSSLYMHLAPFANDVSLQLSWFDAAMLLGVVLAGAASLSRLELRSNRLTQYWPHGKVRREIRLTDLEVINEPAPWYSLLFLVLETGFPLLKALLQKRDYHVPSLDPFLRLQSADGTEIRLRASALPEERENFMIAVDVRLERLRQQASKQES